MKTNRLGRLSDEAIDQLESVLLDAAREGVSVHLSTDGRSVLARGEPAKCMRLGEELRDRRMFSLALSWVRARDAMTAAIHRFTRKDPK